MMATSAGLFVVNTGSNLKYSGFVSGGGAGTGSIPHLWSLTLLAK